MFVHKRAGYVDHKHESVSEARLCEKGLSTTTTIRERSDEGLTIREAKHESPCVCGPYDKCWEFRMADVNRTGNWRDLYRAYND